VPATAERAEPTSPGGAPAPAGGWLVAPWFDLLLVANVAWPLALLVQFGDGFDGRSGLQFWQVYYVTTPHRWVTLLLVFGDRDRFRRRRLAFVGAAAAVVAVVLGVRLSTGALVCLLAVDYVWNAWHFAAQHHGIYRVYGRAADPPDLSGSTFEKWAMRLFLLYATLRVATATWPDALAERWLRPADWFAVAVPAWLVVRELARSGAGSQGRTVYLLSVCALYAALLGAVHERRVGLVLSLATASALFHATEYLALVSWSVRRRHATTGSEMGLLGTLAARWGLVLAVFVVVLGAGGWLLDHRYVELWLGINVVVAFLHYAYDAMIWHRRA
jgi:hypothetical protein